MIAPITFPDCFYTNAQNLTQVSLHFVVLHGSVGVDPLTRLTRALNPATTHLNLKSVTLLASDGNAPVIDLAQAISPLGALQNLIFFNTSLYNLQLPATSWLPSTLVRFSLSACKIIGTLPNNLFNASPALGLIALPDNFLSGSIPAGLLSNVAFSSSSFTLNLNGNQLSGSILPDLFPPSFPASLTTLVVNLGSNALTGPASNLLSNSQFGTTSLSSLSIDLSNNRLTGAVPTWFAGSGLQSFTYLLRVNSNRLSLLPSNLLDFGSQATAAILEINMEANQLVGTIPANIFHPLKWTMLDSFTLNMANNPNLTGDLPISFTSAATTSQLRFFIWTLATCVGLQGTIPSSLFASLPLLAPNRDTTLYFIASDTLLTGPLELPDFSLMPAPVTLTLSASRANFTSFSVAGNGARRITWLDLSFNTMLAGSLPPQLWHNSSVISSLYLHGCPLVTGTVPDLSKSTIRLQHFMMAETGLDFCSGSRGIWAPTSLVSCSLQSTSAFYCGDLYPSSCNPTAPPPMAPLQPPSAPSGCSEAIKPSPEFVCIGSIWTFIGSYEAPTLVIPSGSTSTIIVGNVTSPSVVINGIGSSLVINNGCATNLSTVTLELTQSDLEKLGSKTKTQTLVRLNTTTSTSTSSDGTCSDLSNVNIELKVRGSSCKRVKVSKLSSNSQLSAVLSVDNRSCRTWWIVLIAVVGSVVVIVVLIVLLVVLVPSIRAFVRPFSKRSKANTSVN